MFQAAPGITPALLERIVQARSDVSKADSREVMLDCREVFANKHSNDTSEAVLPAKGKNTTTPFKVALAAAKKRPGGSEQAGSKSVPSAPARSGGTNAAVTVKSAAVATPRAQQPVMISGIPKLEIMSG